MPAANKHSISDVAAEVFAANIGHSRANCSGYLKQIAGRLGVTLPNLLANGLIAYLSKAPGWSVLGHNATQASVLAAKGYFVVAGLEENPNGHVVVVVPGKLIHGSPVGYWGSLRGEQFAGADKSLSWAWKRADLPKVIYFALPPSMVHPSLSAPHRR